MQPLILSNAFLRPRGTRTNRAVSVCDKTNVYACVEEMVDVIREDFQSSPILLPTSFDCESIAKLLDQVDGIFLPGAYSNMHPASYNADIETDGQLFDEGHDVTDLFLVRCAREMGIPYFGICRSMQAMNIAFGGTLLQKLDFHDIDHQCSDPCDGHDDNPTYMHAALIERGGLLAPHFDGGDIAVNSMHDQAIARLGGGLRVEAKAPDGVIEAISWPAAPNFFAAFQWHPEAQPKSRVSQILFKLFKESVHQRFSKRFGRHFA